MDRQDRGALAQQRLWRYVKVTATQDDRTTGPVARPRWADDGRAVGARRVIFALIATILVLVAAYRDTATVAQTVDAGAAASGPDSVHAPDGLVIITGHVLATSPRWKGDPCDAEWPRSRVARWRSCFFALASAGSTGLQPRVQRRDRHRFRAARRRRRLPRAGGASCSASAASGRRGSADPRRCRWRRPARCSADPRHLSHGGVVAAA